jgi:hypothetical protein
MTNQTNKVGKEIYTTIKSSLPIDDDIVIINNVKYQRVEEEPKKPQTLYEALELPYRTAGYMFDGGQKEWICEVVSNWLPNQRLLEHKSIDSYSYGWNDCLNRLRLTLK